MSVQGSSLLSSWLIPYKTYNIHTYIHTYKNTHIETRYYVYLQSQIHLIRVIDLSCGHMYKPLYTSLGCLLSTVHSYCQHSLLVHLRTQGTVTIIHSLGVLYSIQYQLLSYSNHVCVPPPTGHTLFQQPGCRQSQMAHHQTQTPS